MRRAPCGSRTARFWTPRISQKLRYSFCWLLDPSAALNGCELIADGGLTMSFEFRTGSEGASI
jgi:hypothetical protein